MKDGQLKTLIKRAGMDAPGDLFTEHVMKTVQAQEAVEPNPALLPVIKNELLAEPAHTFTPALMARLQPENKSHAVPVITKQFKLIMAAIVGVILLLPLVIPASTAQHSNHVVWGINLRDASLSLAKIAGEVLPYLMPLSVLLLVDYFLRKRGKEMLQGDGW